MSSLPSLGPLVRPILPGAPEIQAELASLGASVASATAVREAVAPASRALGVRGLAPAETRALVAAARHLSVSLALSENPTDQRAVMVGPASALGALADRLETPEPGSDAASVLSLRLRQVLSGLDGPRFAIRHRFAILKSDSPLLLGVVNVTPDSFSDGGVALDPGAALDRARGMVADGADIIDVGGESTRPNADSVDVSEECRRVLPVIERIVGELDVPVSIDTRRAAVAARALAAGACIVNDVSGLEDPEMAAVAASMGAGLVMGHMQGSPGNMQNDPRYANLMGEVHQSLAASVSRAEAAGLPRDAMMVDPGIGFGKTLAHNLELLARVGELSGLASVCVGVSRKSFIGKLCGVNDPLQRLPGSLAAAVMAVLRGAVAVRVHDVAQTRQALDVAVAIEGYGKLGELVPAGTG